DAHRRRLTLARDRFGIKPLLYRNVAGELSFASELDALPRGEIDPDAVQAFLAFNSVPAPLTIFREIRKLEPGHTLTWENGEIALARFARPGPLSMRRDEDEAELVEECRARLRDSVRAHLIADVPVGVLLSGGVDSGALAALAAQESSEPVRTFSIGFEEASFDELDGARAVAARYGTLHREPTRRDSCRRSQQPSTSRSPTRRRYRRTWCRGSPRRTSRSPSPARAATSCSAATTPTSPTCSPSASGRSPPRWHRSQSGCRRPPRASASTTRRSASRA